MNFSYENEGTTTYLVYEVLDTDEVDTMSLGMISNNQIAGLAPVIFTQMDSQKYIKYNVSAKISVQQFFSGCVNKKRLLGVLSGIVDAMLASEEYMIEPNSILLDFNYIFTDVTSCETVLICLPIVQNEQNTVDLGMFFKNLMFSTQFDQTENCDYVAKIFNYLNSTASFSLVGFKSIIDELNSNRTQMLEKQKQQGVMQPETKNQPQGATGEQQKSIVAEAQEVSKQMQPVPQGAKGIPPKRSEDLNQSINMVSPHKMSVPPVIPQMSVKDTASNVPAKNADKPMSMYYLLSHYSKENVAIYKQQKAQKKSSENAVKKNGPVVVPPLNGKKNAEGKTVPSMESSIAGINIPSGKGMEGKTVPPMGSSFAGMNISSREMQSVQVPVPDTKSTTQSDEMIMSMTEQNSNPQSGDTSYGMPQTRSANFGETTVLGNPNKAGETTVLSMDMNPMKEQPMLIRLKNNERIIINKAVFRIGKERSYVDYFIGDNTAVSRSHANIVVRNGEYFVVDTNSTNHTYVNGTMIPSNQEIKLTSGTKIMLANEEFEFKI